MHALSLSSRICLNQIKRNPLSSGVLLLIVVDIHSHILPEVDDGSKSWEISVAMCRMAAADGITHQVATPHANDRYHYDRDYLQGLVAHLQGLVGNALTLSLGCDFHLSYDNLQDVLANPARYAIEGTHYMLVELSNYSVPQQITECFTQAGRLRHHRGDHPSRTQSDSARESAARGGMGGARLRDPGNGISA